MQKDDHIDTRPEYVLDHIPSVPIEQLEQLVPRLIDGIDYHYAEGHLWARVQNPSAPVRLFPSNSESLRIFNLLDGVRTIEEVSRLIVADDSQDGDRATATLKVKRLFAHLARLGICVPVNALPPSASDAASEL